jgi:MFS family permease
MLSHRAVHLPAPFRCLAWSNLAAQSAEQIAVAAAPIIAVMAFGAGEGATGALQTAQTLPFLLMSIPAGLLADRVPRARLMAAAEALRLIALFCVVMLLASGLLTLPLLAVLGFVGACGTVAYGVGAPALVPALVEPKSLPVANGRIELLAQQLSPRGRPWAAPWWAGSEACRHSG